MFAVSGDQMLFAQLDYDLRRSDHDISPVNLKNSKVIPRKFPTDATPMRMMYVEGALQSLVVATMENKEEQKPPNGYRTVQSYLKFIKVHDQGSHQESEIKQESKQRRTRMVKGSHMLKIALRDINHRYITV